MAHEITERDGMFTVREAAWHGLGQVLEDYPTIEEARRIAHPWEPVTEPIFRAVPVIGPEGPVTEYEEVPGHQAVVRSDGLGTLGVVSDTYEPVSNREMYEIAEALEDVAPGEVRLETGGSLMGGRKVWLLVRMAEPLVVPGDPNGGVVPYYALQNAHDGGGAFRGQATMTRIVCDNTAQMADLDAEARGTSFAFSHTKNVRNRIEEAKAALAGWRTSIETYNRQMAHLLGRDVTDADRIEFVERFIPMPPTSTVSERVVANVERDRGLLAEILLGPTCEGIDHTAYGLVAASIEYLNHARRARTEETRFRRSYLDRSTLTADAVELALAVS